MCAAVSQLAGGLSYVIVKGEEYTRGAHMTYVIVKGKLRSQLASSSVRLRAHPPGGG